MSASANAALASRVSYAQVWEDEEVLLGALRPRRGQRLLSIASGGDNALALAIAGAEVTALDLSLPQLHLTELKLAATCLPYGDYLAFLGAGPADDRLQLYRAVRQELSPAASTFWDAHPELLLHGVLGAGRLERFFSLFRRWVLPAIHRRATVEALCDLEDRAALSRFFAERWNSRAWRGFFRLFFSQTSIALLGRSRGHFAQVDAPVAELLLRRAAGALTRIPVRENPYLEWILTGRWGRPGAAKRYLSPAGHAALREARSRIRLVHAELGAHLRSTEERYDGFNYSNLFEYVDEATHAALLERTLDASRPGARVAYWNLFVPRARPQALAERLHRRSDEAAALHGTDRAFFYGAFQLEVVA